MKVQTASKSQLLQIWGVCSCTDFNLINYTLLLSEPPIILYQMMQFDSKPENQNSDEPDLLALLLTDGRAAEP
jgi:hypothetical protein